MRIEQIYTGCLAHAAYYLESNGEAALFDPLREVQPYLDRALRDNSKIKYVFETHFHADFVSGHLDLRAKTGAEIVFGPTARPNYEAIIARDGQEFSVGEYTIRAIHTPGHTMESTVYLLLDKDGREHGIITGDTLFIGDVGRPDLAQHLDTTLTQDKLARHLFRSLRNKIMTLDDALIVYPNHGAGSACGKMISRERTGTLGHQKQTNYALRPDMTEDEFVEEVLSGLTAPPGYFPKNVLMNINGYPNLDTVLEKARQPLDAERFELAAGLTGALVLDTRSAEAFATGFIPGSVNIGLDGGFAGWVGELISDIGQPILLVGDPGKEEEAMIRLSRVGYDNTIGYLAGGFDSWKASGRDSQGIRRIPAAEAHEMYKGNCLVIDVRKNREYATEHVVGAINIPLNQISSRMEEFPRDRPFILHCAGGYRSMVAASILRQRGYEDIADIRGGINEIKKTQMPCIRHIGPDGRSG